jgi:uncharacterized protein (DUF1697 family)
MPSHYVKEPLSSSSKKQNQHHYVKGRREPWVAEQTGTDKIAIQQFTFHISARENSSEITMQTTMSRKKRSLGRSRSHRTSKGKQV